jgi:hypothetical protein
MAWLLTGNYTIAGGLDRCFFFSLLGDCESGTVIDLLTPPLISREPPAFLQGQPESTRLLDYLDGNGVASVTDGLGKIEFTSDRTFWGVAANRRKGER